MVKLFFRVLDNVQQTTIKPIICQTVSEGSLIYTDEYNIYSKLTDWGFTHQTVCHSKGEYARDQDGDGFVKCMSIHKKVFGQYCVLG